MALAVGDVGDELFRSAFGIAEQTVNSLYEHADKIDVLPLVETADIVCLGRFSLMEDEVDGASVVLHVKPVADILSLAVDGKRFAVAYIVDEKGDELFRELIRSFFLLLLLLVAASSFLLLLVAASSSFLLLLLLAASLI